MNLAFGALTRVAFLSDILIVFLSFYVISYLMLRSTIDHLQLSCIGYLTYIHHGFLVFLIGAQPILSIDPCLPETIAIHLVIYLTIAIVSVF